MSFNNFRPEKANVKLKVLHLSSYNIANVPYLLSKGLNQIDGVASICVTATLPYCSYLKYPEDYMLNININPQELQALIAEADIVHIHNNLDELFAHIPQFDIRGALQKKAKIVLQAHGTYHRAYKGNVEKHRATFKFVDIISTPDNLLTSLYPSAFYLPNPVDVDQINSTYKCTATSSTKLIAHSPTNRKGKSTHHLETIIMPELKKSFPAVQLKYLHKISNAECLQQRSQCLLNFDQILVGTYGVGVQESMAQGVIPLVRISQSTDKFLKAKFGSHPFLFVSTDPTIEQTLDKIIMDLSFYKTSPPEDVITTRTLQVPGLNEEVIKVISYVLNLTDVELEALRSKSLDWLRRHHDFTAVTQQLHRFYQGMKAK